MKPEQGQYVKCFMRSSMVLEGIVENWTDAQVVLKSLDGQNIMIVHRPADDIMLTKIVLKEQIENQKPKLPEVKQQIQGKLQEVLQGNDSDLEKKNIAQLREMVVEQDKQIIANKRQEHFGSPGAAKQAVPYSNPLGLSAYSPQPRQKSIAEKLANQETKILRNIFSRRK